MPCQARLCTGELPADSPWLPPTPDIQQTGRFAPVEAKIRRSDEYCDVSWWVGVRQPAGFCTKDIMSGEVGGCSSVRSPSVFRL